MKAKQIEKSTKHMSPLDKHVTVSPTALIKKAPTETAQTPKLSN